ncbi:MAG TPA: hypothetical protein VHS58_15540 [Acetobacteraceae bacterium]|jgi:hypothetical protein|nr:hypothetical protein [Acetobacteraceae bacterium]
MIAGVALLIAGAVVADRWFLADAETAAAAEQGLSLETQWNTTIGALGIEPVYPPQEDIAVGDLFAVAVADDENEPGNISEQIGDSGVFLSKAIKLGHVPVEDEIIAEYAHLPVFTGNTPPALPGAAAVEASSTGSRIFGQGRWEFVLPRAAFPGLTITFAGKAGTGLSLGSRGWFGHTVNRDTVQRLQLRTVETYGISSVTAKQALDTFCKTHKDECSQETARYHLKGVGHLGGRILVKNVNPNTGEPRYAVAIKIFMINRVYMAREIIEEWSKSDSEGLTGRLNSPTPGSASPAAARAPTVSDPLEESLGRRAASGNPAGDSGTSTISFQSDNGMQQVLNEKFPRPIAIGFRSVGYEESSK